MKGSSGDERSSVMARRLVPKSASPSALSMASTVLLSAANSMSLSRSTYRATANAIADDVVDATETSATAFTVEPKMTPAESVITNADAIGTTWKKAISAA